MPAICRGSMVDADIPHCSTPMRLEESPNVFVNKNSGGAGISRQGDNNTGHLLPPNIPPCPSHSAGIATGSTTVKVNGLGIGRVGDGISGCTSVAAGSSNVFAGG